MEELLKAGIKRPRQKLQNEMTQMPRRKRKTGTATSQGNQLEGMPSYFSKLLPNEVLVHIFSFLREKELCHIEQVCKTFQQIASLESLWKDLFHRVYQMESAYVPPTPLDLKSEDLKMLPWKKQFSIMYGCLHVYTELPGFVKQQQNGRWTDDSGVRYYSSVNGALIDSVNGDTIIVHPGVYNEVITLNRSVSLIGVAPEKVLLVNSVNTVVTVQKTSQNVALCNMEIKFDAPLDMSNLRQYCISICNGGQPLIHNCHFTNTSLCGACVYVHGREANPIMTQCTVSNANNVGIFVDDHARGRFENNNIHSNKLAGVWIKNFASPIFRKNEVHHGKDVGFFIFQDGQGILETNDIHSNRIAGIEIKTDANPVIYRCTIHHGSTGGVYVHDRGRGQFIENKIYSNTYAGVWITSESNPTLRDNEIFSGLQGGVYFFGGGRGILENNNIHSNTLAGVQIRTGSDPIIRNNQIHHGLHGGIYVHDSGMGLIEGNEIHSNALAGVWITTGSQPILRHNRIHSGKQVGIYFYDNGGGVLEENDIYNHSFSGIQIRTGSNPVIKKNKIFGGKNGGILIYNSGEGLLEENDIYGNALAGVWIKTDSNPILRRNKIYNGKEGGVCIFNNGRGILEDNDIFNNRLTGVLISSNSQPLLRNNRIFGSKAAGIEITNNGGGLIENNEVFENNFDGICLASGVSPVLSGNKQYNNSKTLEDAVMNGKCLYSISGDNSFPMHDFYRCLTCSHNNTDVICLSCVNACHKEHTVQYIRHDRFFCDCGAGALGCDCQLTGFKAFSSPKVNGNRQIQQHQHTVPQPVQLNTSSTS